MPRSDSLLLRLNQAPGQESESYLDQLMIFLRNPPAGSGDRWIKGAEMCAAWGVPTSHTSVWRLYHSYSVEWRARLALETTVDCNATPETLEKKAALVVAQRSCEILTDPESTPENLISLARIELRKKALEFARQKHADEQRTPVEKAFSVLWWKANFNFEAQFALKRLKEALDNPKPPPAIANLIKPMTPP